MNVGKINKINLNEKTAYLAGLIIGDGNISNSTKSKQNKSPDYRITIELIDKEYLLYVASLIKSIIKTKSKVVKRKKKKGKQEIYYFQFRNKSFYYFLTRDLIIPAGNKCSTVIVPEKIFSSISLQSFFLGGLFEADGGIRGKTIGYTSSSNQLINGISRILKNLKIIHNKECWKNNKYNRQYYGLKISKKSTDKFLNEVPIMSIKKRNKVFCHVDVPEWSNGMVNFKKIL